MSSAVERSVVKERSCDPACGSGASPRLAAIAGSLALSLASLGCDVEEPAQAAMPAPEVTVATPIEREVIEYVHLTGRTEPVEQVELRARVGGYLTKCNFEPGAEVSEGDLLFEIDPRPYMADVARREAEVAQAQAKLQRLSRDLERARGLRARNAMTQQEFDEIAFERNEAEGAEVASKASLDAAKLDLEFTQLKAPISGQIGDRLVDEGNLIMGGSATTTLLAEVVAVDPMAMSFDLDEVTFQRLQQAVREGRVETQGRDSIPVEMGLPIHGTAYPIQGIIRFVNNRVDPRTGTIRVKAEFPNPRPEVGTRVLTPGLFARARVPVGAPRKALLVPESALGMDQGRRFLYVVNERNWAARLEAEVGPLQDDLRVIEGVRGPGDEAHRGLRPDEQVVVVGIQRVRPGMTVVPKPPA